MQASFNLTGLNIRIHEEVYFFLTHSLLCTDCFFHAYASAGNIVKVNYYLPEAASLTIQMLSVDGKIIRTLLREVGEQGSHTAFWDGADDKGIPVPQGIYVCRILTPGSVICSTIARVR